jgi:hypothetical protein
MSKSALATADPPEIAIAIDLHLDQDDLNSQMKAVSKQLLPGWDALLDADIEVSIQE